MSYPTQTVLPSGFLLS